MTEGRKSLQVDYLAIGPSPARRLEPETSYERNVYGTNYRCGQGTMGLEWAQFGWQNLTFG
jgi:hypothetical protein